MILPIFLTYRLRLSLLSVVDCVKQVGMIVTKYLLAPVRRALRRLWRLTLLPPSIGIPIIRSGMCSLMLMRVVLLYRCRCPWWGKLVVSGAPG